MGKWWLCGTALAITMVSLSMVAGVATTKKPAAPTTAKAEVTVAESFGTFGVYEGKLALFCDEDTPKIVYDVWVNTLPPEEQQRLAAGIVVPTRAAFLALLQEYTG